MKKSYKAEEEGHYGGVMPKITVMQPTVENVSNEVAPENVASEEIVIPDVNLDYSREDGR